jgi:hypothetical protein
MIRRLLVALSLIAAATACFKVKVDAPVQSGDYVLGTGEQESITRVKTRCWYLFWGLLPVSDNSSAEAVKKLPPGTRIVKVQTGLDSGSFFFALLTVGIVGTSVIIVEGVAPPMPPGEHEIVPVESSIEEDLGRPEEP